MKTGDEDGDEDGDKDGDGAKEEDGDEGGRRRRRLYGPANDTLMTPKGVKKE